MELTPTQNRAVHTIDSNLQLIACAGSGKTEVITRRLAYILTSRPEVQPEQIVAFTFTNKAGTSMKQRIQKALEDNGYDWEGKGDQMYVGTIHAFCKFLLDRCGGEFQNFCILDTVKTHLFIYRYGEACGRCALGLKGTPNDIKLFSECIEKMVDDYDNRHDWPQEQQDVFEAYRSALYAHHCMDFSLLILETLREIHTNPDIQAYLQNIRYLVVDEYQDVNDLQEKLIACFAEAGANLCVVGDDDQTIYQFRGSNADNMIGFAQRYPNVTQIRLEDNFRCAPSVVDVADTVIRNNEKRLEKTMRAQGGGVSAGDRVEARCFASEQMQYEEIAQKILQQHQKGVPYSEIAVLVRKGKYIDPISDCLAQHGIPYYTDSAKQFFQGKYFRRFVETLSILQDIDKPKLAECWGDRLSPEGLNGGFRYLRRVARSGGTGQTLPLSGILRGFAEQAHFLQEDAFDLGQRQDDLNGIATILDDYDMIYGDQQMSARINGVLRFLEDWAAEEYKYHSFQDQNVQEDAVQLMTVHKSKGLEFHTVFLPNLQKGEFPGSNRGGRKYWHILGGTFETNKEQYASDVEDERKLFYVAVTRAKAKLYLYCTDEKHPISKFLAEAAQSSSLHAEDLDPAELEIARYDVDLADLKKRLLEKVLAGAYSGLGGMFVEAADIRHASPAELLRYAGLYNVPLTK